MSVVSYVIAGSEASGGAGIQADLRTFAQLGTYGVGTITCIVSFDPNNEWSHRFVPVDSGVIADQIEVATAAHEPEVVKIGMLGTPATISTVAQALGSRQWRDVVVDPVLICKGQEPGAALDTDNALRSEILPLATVVTPNLFEAATLAGLLRAPATYNPINHPEAAADRAKLVIAAMVEMGVVTRKEAESALSASGEIAASNYVPSTRYVVDWLNEQLPDLIKHYSQSIIIETTIDAKLQSFAERALRKRLNEEGKKLAASEGALVILDTTGAVKAMVGGKSYRRSQFNRVTKAKRQPGSAFKPFVYLAAIEAGLTPDTIEVDEPVRLGSWVPENYKQQYMGPVTLRKALALSLNTVAVKLSTYVGPPAVIEAAHRLGILSPLGKDASIALGTSEVTLLELTDAMVPFANGGTPVVPFAITRIRSRDGVLLYERAGDGFQPVVTSQSVAAMNDMLRAVVTEGTARRAQFGSFDIAGKTGTSQNYRDAWFIGYTTYYIGGVWVGNDDNAPTRKVTGGSIPTAIWKDVMEVAHEGLDPAPLPFSTGSEGEYFAYDDEFNTDPGDGSGGLLSALESLFGTKKSGEPRKKKRPTAFERAEKARESR